MRGVLPISFVNQVLDCRRAWRCRQSWPEVTRDPPAAPGRLAQQAAVPPRGWRAVPGPLSRAIVPAPPVWDRGHGPPSATQGGGPWRPRALRLTENPTRRYLPGGPGPEPRRLAAPGVKRVPAVLARRPFQERPGRGPPGYNPARVVPGDRPARGLLRPAAQCLSCLSEPAAPCRRPLMGRYSTGRKRARTSGGGFLAGDLLSADLWRRDAAGMSAGFLLGC